MSSETDSERITIEQFVESIRAEWIPLGSKFSYFFAVPSLNEEDTREYLSEPVAAIPPEIMKALPKVAVCLVPYLERNNGKVSEHGVRFDKPAENRDAVYVRINANDQATLLFSIEGREVADYHYFFFRALAEIMAGRASDDDMNTYQGLLREELGKHVHGEVDEGSWRLKLTLERRQGSTRKASKGFLDYARQSYIDTLTLYMHGICCDIDVDTGPRQLASRHLRKRLEMMRAFYPPPAGFSVFPEDLKNGATPAARR